MGQVGGRLVHAAFVFAVEMPVHICSHSSWWVTDCQLEILQPLVRVLGLKIFLIGLLFVKDFDNSHILGHRGSRVTVCHVHMTYYSLYAGFECVEGHRV